MIAECGLAIDPLHSPWFLMLERLNKLIAAAGLASRRHAEEMILAGDVTVNGQVVCKLGAKADPEHDHIKVAGKLINPRLARASKVYVLLNKPKGYLSSKFDPEGRPLVTQLLPDLKPDVHPVGRLDFNSEGLLLLTNDGEPTHRLTAPRYHVSKVYLVKVKGVPAQKQIEMMRRRLNIEGRRTAPAGIEKVGETESNSWFSVALVEGRNQQIRKMFEKMGHSVLKLKRVAIGPLGDAGLPLGKSRRLSAGEVTALRFACGLEEGKRQEEKGKRRKEAGNKKVRVSGRPAGRRVRGGDKREEAL